MGDEYIFMIGLRKVVNLKIYDLPRSKVAVKKNEQERTFGYSYSTKYYIGNSEVFSTGTVNSEKKSVLSPRKFSDEHLTEMIRNSVTSEDDLERVLEIDEKGFMYFDENGTKIVYYGEKKDELKHKLLAKRK